jgi:hypothetical protein
VGHPSGAPPDKGSHALSVLRPARSETTFVGITPCRIVNTILSGDQLVNNTTRTYYVGGTTGFAPQGGKSGGCGIPLAATAIAATVTAPTPAGHGYLRMYPANQTEPQATALSYLQGLSGNTGTTIPIEPGVAKSLAVKNHLGPTNLIIDVAGYYIPQIEGMVSPTATIYAGSTRLVSAVHNSLGSFTVTVDTNVANCTPTVTAYSGYVYASASNFNNNKVQVYLWYLSGGTQTAYDGYFYLKVDC